jgi:RimJ/RimL family protein N-acetyltransferase
MVTVLPALHDDVIVLTGYTGQDLSAHLAGANGETAHRFGAWPKTTAPATAQNAFAHWAHEWETGSSTRAFAARDQVTGQLLGGCELRIQPRGTAHVRYWTAAADRGCGYATRSLVLLLRYARTIGIRQATAHIAAGNHASRRVAEKAGFRSAAAFTAADGTCMIQYLVDLTRWS